MVAKPGVPLHSCRRRSSHAVIAETAKTTGFNNTASYPCSAFLYCSADTTTSVVPVSLKEAMKAEKEEDEARLEEDF